MDSTEKTVSPDEGNRCIALNRERRTSHVRVHYAQSSRSKSKLHKKGEDKTINAEVPVQLCKKQKSSSSAGKKLVMPKNKKKSSGTRDIVAAPCELPEDSPPRESAEETPEKRFSKRHKPKGKAVDNLKRRLITKNWNSDDQMFLDFLDKGSIISTRFAHKDIFIHLGIWEDMTTLFENMGLAKLCTMSYLTHPKFVREFLASVIVTYKDEARPLASQGTLSFKIGEQFYSMTIFQLCEVFGFKTTGEQVSFPELTTKQKDFWSLIGTGEYSSSRSKQSLVRNPVLRCALKVISSVFFARAAAGSVQQRELMMLFNGVKHLLTGPNGEPIPDDGGQDINYGSILAAEFVKERSLAQTAIEKSRKFESYIGGLVTPILDYHRIDLTKSPANEKFYWIDDEHLLYSNILVRNDSAELIYQFQKGTKYFWCILPQPDITSLISKENIEFLPSSEKLCAHPQKSVCHGVVQLPREIGEEELGEESPHHFNPEKYRLPPIDCRSQRRKTEWMCNALRINNKLMLEICKVVMPSQSQPNFSDKR